MSSNENNHYIGHRARLKARFALMPDKIEDYELLELLLFLSIPRRDVKALAKKILAKYGSIADFIYSNKDAMQNIDGIGESSYSVNLLLQEIIARCLKQRIEGGNVIGSWQQLLDYLKITMGKAKTEQFRILFLNKKNILIADELQTVGTIDQAPVYPREVVKRALFHEASAIIIVHNHPSGNPTPSRSDIQMTQAVADACKVVNVILHDHVIITSGENFSFKSNLLLK